MRKDNILNVGLVFGGRSTEHDISIISAIKVKSNLDLLKYNVVMIYLDKENNIKSDKRLNTINNVEEFIKLKNIKNAKVTYKNKTIDINNITIDVFINCTHGNTLEDGTMSSIFEFLNTSYTSCDHYTSSLLHNKYYTKMFLKANQMPYIDYLYINEYMWNKDLSKVIKQIEDSFFKKNLNIIIKPCKQGSSIGISCVDTFVSRIELIKIIENCFTYDDELIIETRLKNFNEYNQAIYFNNEYKLSNVFLVSNNSNIYTFDDKYIKQKEPNNQVLTNNNLLKRINKLSLKIATLSNSFGVIRVDYLIDNMTKALYVNEVNVIPGSLSLDLFDDNITNNIIMSAMRRNESRKYKVNTYTSNALEMNKVFK